MTPFQTPSRAALLTMALALAACAAPTGVDTGKTGSGGTGTVGKKSPTPKPSGTKSPAGTTGDTTKPSATPTGTTAPAATPTPSATPAANGTPTPTPTPAGATTPTPTPTATATGTAAPVAAVATAAPNLPAGALTVETYAGTGTAGFSKDPVAIAAATFNKPRGLALGPDGAVYVADTGNHAIRKIKDGMVTTVIGTGVTTSQNDTLTLNAPNDLAVDTDGTLYIADTLNHRIRKLRPGATELDFLCGNGGAGFLNGTGDGAQVNNPVGVALDGKGGLWVIDSGNHAVRKVKTATGELTTLGGKKDDPNLVDGATAVSRFSDPARAFSLGDAVFVADSSNDAVRKVTADGTASTVAETALAIAGASSVVSTVDGSLLVLGSQTLRLVKFTAPSASTSIFTNAAGSGFKDGPIADAQFKSLDDILVLPTGEILIADGENNRIRKIKGP